MSDSVRGTIPARVKSRGSPESFDFTARFIVADPKQPNEIAEHDRGWLELIGRTLKRDCKEKLPCPTAE